MGNNSRDLVPLQGPDAQREADSKKGKNRSWMLIGEDKGHVELSVVLAGTWAVSARTALVDHRKDLGHANFCPLSCLSVGMLLHGRGPLLVFLRQLSHSKAPSAEPMIESDKWSLPYLKAATLY